jgi:hypothetical protein
MLSHGTGEREIALVCAVCTAFLYFFSNPGDCAAHVCSKIPDKFVSHAMFVRLPTRTRRD